MNITCYKQTDCYYILLCVLAQISFYFKYASNIDFLNKPTYCVYRLNCFRHNSFFAKKTTTLHQHQVNVSNLRKKMAVKHSQG